MSDAGFLVCHSNATINSSLDNILLKMEDYSNRHHWDPNFEKGMMVKEIGPDVSLHYVKTKKVAVVSSRDQYLLIYAKEIPA